MLNVLRRLDDGQAALVPGPVHTEHLTKRPHAMDEARCKVVILERIQEFRPKKRQVPWLFAIREPSDLHGL
jgi:hypothetical protein